MADWFTKITQGRLDRDLEARRCFWENRCFGWCLSSDLCWFINHSIYTYTDWSGTWMLYLPIYWEYHHPNWRTHIFQRGWNHQPDNDHHYISFSWVNMNFPCCNRFHFRSDEISWNPMKSQKSQKSYRTPLTALTNPTTSHEALVTALWL